MKQKVIANNNLPIPMPLHLSFTCWLLLDRFNAAGWVWGVVGTILVLFWVVFFVTRFTHEYVDLFKEG